MDIKDLDNVVTSLLIKDHKKIDQYENDDFNDYVVDAKSLRESVLERVYGEKKNEGFELPWRYLENKFMIRQGELSIFNGINGHGKSLMLNQLVAGCINQKAKVCIASLEMQPEETIIRMATQMSCIPEDVIQPKVFDEYFERVDGSLFLYSEVGDMTPKRVKALCKYVRAELNVDIIVIDSLMKCGTGDGDYAAEKRLVNSLQNIAKQSGLHIFLVTHAKKQIDEFATIGKFDVSGSGKITDIGDNVFTCWRNKKKEKQLRNSELTDENRAKLEAKPDSFLICDKQRHGTGWEGAIALWFHLSRHYSTKQGLHRPML